MHTLSRAAALFAFLSVLTLDAAAAVHMQVSGRVDLDGDFTFESNTFDAVTTLPFPQPTIAVSDSLPGTFSYFAEADSATPALRVSGSVTSAGAWSNLETGILHVAAEMDDVVTLNSTLSDPYDVTVQMTVDGTLQVAGSDGRGSATLQVRPNDGLGPFDAHFYTNDGPVHDVVSQTVTLAGNTQTLGIFTRLVFSVFQLDAGVTAAGDFAHTLKLTLILPAGVTLEGSASGRFDTAPVPLPAGSAMFAPALLGLVATIARRRAHC